MSQQPAKQQSGDQKDNFGQAAKELAKATKQAGKTAGKEAAKSTVRAAASTVKGGAKVGKAAANIAKGTAVGGIWGAIIAVAWSLRHTLYKILVCVCIFVLLLIIAIVSFPSILFSSKTENRSFLEIYDDLSYSINASINEGYQRAVDSIMARILTNPKYDLVLSLTNIIDNTEKDKPYDICYIIALYSASMHQHDESKANLLEKLKSVENRMFSVSYEERTANIETENAGGEIVLETVTYLSCTISAFDDSVLLDAFNLNLDEEYSKGITNREYVEYMSASLRKTLEEKK